MPCWEVRTMSVEFVAKNKDLLIQTLKDLKWSYEIQGDRVYIFSNNITLNLKEGKASMPQTSMQYLNELKRAYAKTAIQAAAKKNRWATRTVKGNKMQFVKYA